MHSLAFNALHLARHLAVQVQQAEQLLEDLPASLPDQVGSVSHAVLMPSFATSCRSAFEVVLPIAPHHPLRPLSHAGGGRPAGGGH